MPALSDAGLISLQRLCVQYLTLAFIGFISASSMRGFLRDMRRAFSVISGGGNTTTLVSTPVPAVAPDAFLMTS